MPAHFIVLCLILLFAPGQIADQVPGSTQHHALKGIVLNTKVNSQLAHLMDLSEFEAASLESISMILTDAVHGGSALVHFVNQQDAMSKSSGDSLTSYAHRLLSARVDVIRAHSAAVAEVISRGGERWSRRFNRSYSLVLEANRLLERALSLSADDRKPALKRLKSVLTAGRADLNVIENAMSAEMDDPDSMIQFVTSVGGANYWRMTSFLLAMTAISLRSAELAVADAAIDRDGGIMMTEYAMQEEAVIRWKPRMIRLSVKLKTWGTILKNKKDHGLYTQVKRFVDIHKKLQDTLFVIRLQKYLMNQFPGRYWFVLTYENKKSRRGNKGVSVSMCGGLVYESMPNQRILLIASSNIGKTRFDADLARRVLKTAELDGLGGTDDAEQWMGHISGRFGTNCVTNAFVGALCYANCKPVWVAAPDRLAYKRLIHGPTSASHIIVFG